MVYYTACISTFFDNNVCSSYVKFFYLCGILLLRVSSTDIILRSNL